MHGWLGLTILLHMSINLWLIGRMGMMGMNQNSTTTWFLSQFFVFVLFDARNECVCIFLDGSGRDLFTFFFM